MGHLACMQTLPFTSIPGPMHISTTFDKHTSDMCSKTLPWRPDVWHLTLLHGGSITGLQKVKMPCSVVLGMQNSALYETQWIVQFGPLVKVCWPSPCQGLSLYTWTNHFTLVSHPALLLPPQKIYLKIFGPTQLDPNYINKINVTFNALIIGFVQRHDEE